MALISGMSDVRVIVTFVTLGGCLLILYPKVFSPLMFGAKKDKAIQNTHKMHPHHKAPPRGPGSDEPNQPPVGLPPNMDAEIQRHMRGGPHPGMRHAADMSKQQSKTGGGRGGIMGMVLPVYAVGIIGYLIYTLVKVYNKSSKGEYNKKPGYGKLKNKSPNTSEESSTFEEASLSELKESSAKLTELENLLSKADDKSISTDEMRALQTRLEETEKQMARILQAMQTVSSKMTNVSDDSKGVPVKEESEQESKDDSDQSPEKEEECNESDSKETGIQKEWGTKEKEEKGEEQKEEVILLDGQKEKSSEEESGVRQRKVLSEQNED
ncbi:uncharacterized protein LOC111112042 [Crassostrea virginica]